MTGHSVGEKLQDGLAQIHDPRRVLSWRDLHRKKTFSSYGFEFEIGDRLVQVVTPAEVPRKPGVYIISMTRRAICLHGEMEGYYSRKAKSDVIGRVFNATDWSKKFCFGCGSSDSGVFGRTFMGSTELVESGDEYAAWESLG